MPEELRAQIRRMANEAARYPDCSVGFLVALALTYRRILLDRMADPRDKAAHVDLHAEARAALHFYEEASLGRRSASGRQLEHGARQDVPLYFV